MQVVTGCQGWWRWGSRRGRDSRAGTEVAASQAGVGGSSSRWGRRSALDLEGVGGRHTQGHSVLPRVADWTV